jgi:hypothetical protein
MVAFLPSLVLLLTELFGHAVVLSRCGGQALVVEGRRPPYRRTT